MDRPLCAITRRLCAFAFRGALRRGLAARAWLLPMAGLAWAVVIAAGGGALLRYGHARGNPARAAAVYALVDNDSHGALAPRQRPNVPMLLVFAHPRCPCTRATIAELDRLLTRLPVRPDVWVVFVRPAGEPDGWERSDLWDTAAALPGVQVRVDPNGDLAQRLGVATSGQVLLYDGAGRLAFAGGITAARGHAGDNAGADAIAALLTNRPTNAHDNTAHETAHTPVFGCDLSSPGAAGATARAE